MSILDKASLYLPLGAGYKSGSLWMSKPLNDDAYFTVSRGSVGTRTTDCAEVSTVLSNIPRLNYRNNTPCFLIEESKTNLEKNSHGFTNGGSNPFNPNWYDSNVTIANNTAASPEGKINAHTLTLTSTSFDTYTTYENLTNGTKYTWSCYVKLGTAISFCVVPNDTQDWNAFNAQAGAIKKFTSADGLSTSEWTRISISVTANSTGKINLHLGSHSNSSIPQQDAGTVFIWGIQMEAGHIPTSLVKTTGSAVTRSADSFRITGNRALPYIGGTQGTIYFWVYYKNNAGSYQQFMYYTDASASQSYMFVNSTRYIQTNLNLGSMQSSVQLVDGSFNKVAVKYMPGKTVMYLNGQQVATGSPSSILNHANIDLGSYAGSSEFSAMEFVEYAHFDQVLSNEEMQSLTTL